MRMFIAPALALAPALGAPAAQAGELTEKTLAPYRSNCVQNCSKKHAVVTCRQACQCMSDEMKAHWTKERYDRYAGALQKKPQDAKTKNIVQQLAAYCFQKAMQQ